MLRAPRTLALLPASVLLASSLWGQKSEGRFWNWFQAHDSALFAVKTGNEPICGELSEELHRVHPALTFEFGPVESGRREFVLSADGIKDAFPAVLALGRAAPALSRWTIIRFRPPRPDVTQISVGGLQLDARTVQFLAEPDGDRTGLTVSVPGYKATPNKTYEQAAYLLLDGMLGEYAVETAVGFIKIVPADGRRPGQWRPLNSHVSFPERTITSSWLARTFGVISQTVSLGCTPATAPQHRSTPTARQWAGSGSRGVSIIKPGSLYLRSS